MQGQGLTKFLSLILLITGAIFTLINIYGLSKDIRPKSYVDSDLRFIQHNVLPFEEALQEVQKNEKETDLAYAKRLVKTINASLVHIKWLASDPEKYNQRVPIWENYFLYFLGVFSDIPEFQRYHFSNYQRSIKRGIGICGDASMIMSQLLSKNGIDNRIVSYPGHVVVSIPKYNDITFDPDFGIYIPHSHQFLTQSPTIAKPYYQQAGYSKQDIKDLIDIYTDNFHEWHGVKHFITKKYYLEKVVYWLKWPLPLVLFFIGFYGLTRKSNKG